MPHGCCLGCVEIDLRWWGTRLAELSWAQAASEDLRQQRSKQDEALFEERKKHQADLNMVKESNASLR